MKGRKPRPSRFRKAFMAAAAILTLSTGTVTLDNLPKDPVTDTQSVVTFNVGAEDQYGYNISPVDQFWKHTLSLKSEDQMNAALLSAAAEADSWRTRALIQQGLDMVKYGDRAMVVAAGAGGDDVIKALLEAGVSPSSVALMAAAENNHTQAALTLLAAGANGAAESSTALISAAGHGNTTLVEALLADGARADAQNNAALMAAITGGHSGVADMLLSAEKTVMVPMAPPPVYDFDHLGMSTFNYNNPLDRLTGPFSLNAPDAFGPPFYMDFRYDIQTVDAINVNANNGQALYEAVYRNDTDMVRTLMKHGADVDARDGAIKRLANESRNVEMVNLLNGKTPVASFHPNFMGP